MGAEIAYAGMARSSLLARVVIAASRKRRVGGGDPVHQESRSLNDGSSECPSNGQTPIPASVTTPTVMKAARGARLRVPARAHSVLQPDGYGRFTPLKPAPRSKIRQSAGVTVIAKTSEAAIAST